MRMEQPWSRAALTTSRTRSELPILPGLMRRQAAPALAASMARLVVEMDVGDDRHVHFAHDFGECRGAFLVGAGDAHDIDAGELGQADLRDGGLRVVGEGVGHGLHGDRRVAADRHFAHVDLAGFAAVDFLVGAVVHGLGVRCWGRAWGSYRVGGGAGQRTGANSYTFGHSVVD